MKRLTGKKLTRSGRLLFFDLRDLSMDFIRLLRLENCNVVDKKRLKARY